MLIFQVNAFTNKPFSGNPAAVCLLSEPKTDAWLQAVAAEMNLSETAFLWKWNKRESVDYDLRWFTPTTEVDLCGHATLASAHVLWDEGLEASSDTIHFHTRGGVLSAFFQDNEIVLDFPADPPSTVNTPPNLAAALGVAPVSVGLGRFDYLVELESPKAVHVLAPNYALLRKIPARGFIVTARDEDEYDFVSRFFAPGAGIDEDPVTGSAHCCLAPFWQTRLGKSELIAWQDSKRGGRIAMRIENDRVYLGGQAIMMFKGNLSNRAYLTELGEGC